MDTTMVLGQAFRQFQEIMAQRGEKKEQKSATAQAFFLQGIRNDIENQRKALYDEQARSGAARVQAEAQGDQEIRVLKYKNDFPDPLKTRELDLKKRELDWRETQPEGGTTDEGFTAGEKRVYDILTQPQQMRIKQGLFEIQSLQASKRQGYVFKPDPKTKTMGFEWIDPDVIDAQIKDIWDGMMSVTGGDEEMLREMAGKDFPKLETLPGGSVGSQIEGDTFNLFGE